MTTLTIRLDPKLEKALDRIAKRTGRTKSEIVREALRRQIAVARFRELRSKTLPFAEAQGLVTDEDVFRALLVLMVPGARVRQDLADRSFPYARWLTVLEDNTCA